jgi:hypothetical protein
MILESLRYTKARAVSNCIISNPAPVADRLQQADQAGDQQSNTHHKRPTAVIFNRVMPICGVSKPMIPTAVRALPIAGSAGSESSVWQREQCRTVAQMAGDGRVRRP